MSVATIELYYNIYDVIYFVKLVREKTKLLYVTEFIFQFNSNNKKI